MLPLLLPVLLEDRSLLPPLLLDEDEPVEDELTDEEEEPTPILPSGGRLRSGAGNLTLFLFSDESRDDCVFNIGW